MVESISATAYLNTRVERREKSATRGKELQIVAKRNYHDRVPLAPAALLRSLFRKTHFVRSFTPPRYDLEGRAIKRRCAAEDEEGGREQSRAKMRVKLGAPQCGATAAEVSCEICGMNARLAAACLEVNYASVR